MKLQIGQCPIAHSAFSGIVPQISGIGVIKILCRNGFVVVQREGEPLYDYNSAIGVTEAIQKSINNASGGQVSIQVN
ncbi:hypothetical protein HYV85_04360 [Candidatus Woesearchaeota archaeon]|nr:hypothetical protein [Candidatus Woesearchaeota archaeon]